MEINNITIEESNTQHEPVKKQWVKPEMKTLAISTSTTQWEEELSTVGPWPS